MNLRETIKEHMPVLASDGSWIGKVDFLKTDRIILTKDGPQSNGDHHSIPMAWVTSVEDDKVKLNQTTSVVRDNWIVMNPNESE